MTLRRYSMGKVSGMVILKAPEVRVCLTNPQSRTRPSCGMDGQAKGKRPFACAFIALLVTWGVSRVIEYDDFSR